MVLAYGLFQWVVAQSFLWMRTRTSWYWPFPAALLLTTLPLIGARFLPLTIPGAQLGFVGISYLTFRSLDVIFCIRDRLIVSLPAGQFSAFLFFFPTISSGPVDRYRRFGLDWNRSRPAAEIWKDLDGAVHRVFTGFLYKFILAALIKSCWIDRLAHGGILNTLSYMYGYSLYLYFDFAGYSAFAIGIGYLLGIRTPENFNRPFLAGNIKDFWSRWHISLSTWFRDHVYMRFLLTATKRSLVRRQAHGLVSRVLPLIRPDGDLARNRALLFALWRLPRDAPGGARPVYPLEQRTKGLGERTDMASDGNPDHVPPGLPGLPPLLWKDWTHVE